MCIFRVFSYLHLSNQYYDFVIFGKKTAYCKILLQMIKTFFQRFHDQLNTEQSIADWTKVPTSSFGTCFWSTVESFGWRLATNDLTLKGLNLNGLTSGQTLKGLTLNNLTSKNLTLLVYFVCFGLVLALNDLTSNGPI